MKVNHKKGKAYRHASPDKHLYIVWVRAIIAGHVGLFQINKYKS